jgi:hypothetical protein
MSSIQLSKENNAMFRNFYHCSECGEEWTDEWSCTCNDRCPKCNAETSPYSSEEIDAVICAEKKYAAFDVDGTLLRDESSHGYEDTPNYPVIEMYMKYKAAGYQMVVWSGSGRDWARTWAMKLGLKHRFEDVAGDPICMEKPRLDDPNRLIPDVVVDNEEVLLGKENIRV